MLTTIINDCRDDNARGRQIIRVSSLLNCSVNFIGVASDLEAGGNLIDAMDAYQEQKAVVLVNVAPRDGHAKQWENGTPFGYFYYKKILVVSSISGLTLSLAKKLRLTDYINILDIRQVATYAAEQKLISEPDSQTIVNTQFRSYEFLPLAASWLLQSINLPSVKYPIEKIADAPLTIWWTDNFGNCKTTLLNNELNEKNKKILRKKFGRFSFYNRLKDVPDNETAFVTGSSGLENRRFIEIVTQGGKAIAVIHRDLNCR